MRVKEESEKTGLKLSIQKTKIMASGPITSWQIDRETMETVTDFILGGGPKITADGEIERHLLLGRKAMTNLDSILKSRDITLPKKVHIVKAMSFICLFNLNSKHITWNAGLHKEQARIKMAGKNINKLRYKDDTTLMAETEAS